MITVTKDYKLIAGYHRLRAFELLGIESIPIRIIDCTALKAEMAEIDENLIRNNGTELEQGMSLARRKVIYLVLHPETAKGTSQANGANKAQGNVNSVSEIISFTSDTAKKTNKSKRIVEIKSRIGEKLGGMATEIIAAGIDDSQKDLTELAKLKDKAPEQVQVALLTA